MKKHILAIAVASALPAIAVAQNVSISGAVDLGIQSYDSGTDTYLKAFEHGLTTSRLVFSGSEDLGGGLKASFTLDMRVNPTGGTQNTTAAFNRGAFVGLSGGFGTLQIGQNDTTINQDIDAKVSQAANFGLSASIGYGLANAPDTQTVTNGELGSDQANVIRYISPRINGVQVEIGFQGGNGSSATSDGKTDVLDLAASYEQGPLGIYVARADSDATTAGTARTSTAFGAKYDLGVVSVGAFTRKAEMNNSIGDITINQASARMPLGDGLALHGVYATGKIKDVNNGKGSGFIVGVTKALSKRTTVYGMFSEVDSKSGASFVMPGLNGGSSAAVDGADPKAVTIGISHTF
jgi:GBP family porin